ncbi:MAG TPA: hypothetical protein VGQ17_01445 [Gemmatimonadales bacterium]|jgi:hypothetical protein|nr:hypothetical protein [Gemmatimonadales bacterium]
MLTSAQLGPRADSPRIRRARPLPSAKQRYQAYLLQRIEDYKNSLARGELLKLGNDAASELRAATDGQYFLTEVVMQETVDQLIIKRLSLPTFSRWRQKFARLRQAQQSPTHWGIERRGAVAAVLPRLEPGDHAVVVGGGAEAAAYLLAAHDVRVTCLCSDGPTCTRIETRMAAESLTGYFEALAVNLGTWFPELELPANFVVIDAATLAELESNPRLALMARLQDVTLPGGLHAVVPGEGAGTAEAWLSLYPDWERIPLPNEPGRRGTKRAAPPGILLSCPMSREPTQVTEAEDSVRATPA